MTDRPPAFKPVFARRPAKKPGSNDVAKVPSVSDPTDPGRRWGNPILIGRVSDSSLPRPDLRGGLTPKAGLPGLLRPPRFFSLARALRASPTALAGFRSLK